jgi:hypothetical protein
MGSGPFIRIRNLAYVTLFLGISGRRRDANLHSKDLQGTRLLSENDGLLSMWILRIHRKAYHRTPELT